MRRLRAVVVVAALVGAAAASAAGGAPPALEHPNPLLTNLSLDYVKPIPAPTGGDATLATLEQAVIGASMRDLAYLRYSGQSDWGGFESAPLGWLAFKTGGAVILGSRQQTGVASFKTQAENGVKSYMPLHGLGHGHGSKPPPNPPVPQPPLPNPTPLPCANSGFGGTACNGNSGGSGKHSGGGGGGSGGNGSGGNGSGSGNGSKGNCGTAGLSIVSDLSRCRIYVLNQAPGDGTFERLTIKNTSSSRYTLSFEASGTETALWNELELGVWRTGSPAPTPLPPLHFWTTQFTQLVTLDVGETAHFTIELYLPATAGNGSQHESAVVDFNWRATS